MADVLAVWLLMLGTLSLACNLAYICRDMARESRKERRQAQKNGRNREDEAGKRKSAPSRCNGPERK